MKKRITAAILPGFPLLMVEALVASVSERIASILPSLLSAFAVALFAFSVFQMNSITRLAYSLQETRELAGQLEEELAKMEVKTAHRYSQDRLAQLAQEFSFEKIGSITYIQLPEGTFAKNLNRQ